MPGPAVLPVLSHQIDNAMMNRWKAALARYMRGRYGIDALYRALMVSTFVFLVLNLLFPSLVFYALSLGSVVWSTLRVMSRQHARRAAENQRYLALKSRARQGLLQTRNRLRDIRTHRYRRCPSCRQLLRLPRKPGVNHVKCPVCKQESDINIRF